MKINEAIKKECLRHEIKHPYFIYVNVSNINKIDQFDAFIVSCTGMYVMTKESANVYSFFEKTPHSSTQSNSSSYFSIAPSTLSRDFLFVNASGR